MAKIRVYELAKQLSTTSKELIDVLKELAVEDVKSHQSSIDDAVAKKAAAIFIKRSVAPLQEDVKPEKIQEAKPKKVAAEKSDSDRPSQPIKQEQSQAKVSTVVKKFGDQSAKPKVASQPHSPQEREKPAQPPAKKQLAPDNNVSQQAKPLEHAVKPSVQARPPSAAKTPSAHPKPHSVGNAQQPAAKGKPPVTSAHSQTSAGTQHPAGQQAKPASHAQRPYRPGGVPNSIAKVQSSHPKRPALVKKEVAPKPIEVVLPITIGELVSLLGLKPADILKKLLDNGRMLAINHSLDKDSIFMILDLMEIEHEKIAFKEDLEIGEEEEADDPRFMLPRPPVVTVLGHVDHGKTSLLDAIRKTNVTAGEAGGITQKIGAYIIEHDSKKITFLDTPGHEAFTAMRARGAQVTDVVVLVVAADDGVMPQTIEAISHAKAAKVPIIIALNKIDKPEANPDRVKQQLADHELLTEDWGGDIVCVPVSAKAKMGIDELLEMILLVAEMNDYKANPRRLAHGVIIESKLDKGLGPIATVLVKKGTLKVGDAVIAGMASGRIRLLLNDKGDKVKKATPSVPVEIVGLTELPNAGDILRSVKDDKLARQISGDRHARDRERNLVSGPKTTLQDIFKNMEEGVKKDLSLIIKADSNGSVEAIKHSLAKLPSDEVNVQVIHGAVGAITESDVSLARASGAIIIGFNIKEDPNIRKFAEQERIDIRLYNVIYHMIEDIQAAMKGLLEPEYESVLIGKAEVRQIFKVSKTSVIAGCYVQEGKIVRNGDIKVYRGKNLIHEGKLDSLKRFKDDAKEVLGGFECGISLEKFKELEPGDIIEVYQTKEKERV